MKTIVAICVLAAAIASVLATDGDIMDTFDGIAIVNDEPKFRALYGCIIDQSPCDKENQRLKEGGVKVVPTNCGDCTPAQKEKLEKMMKLATEKYPKEMQDILNKFASLHKPE